MNNRLLKSAWTETALGEVAELVIDYRGKTPKKLGGDWSEDGYRALSAKNIKDGRVVNVESIRFVDEALYRKWMKEEIHNGDLILTSEAPLGECYFWNSDEKIVLSQRLFAIRVKKDILDPRFFYIYARSRIFQGELHGRASGSTVQGIRQSELLKTKVILPPLAEQRFIADLLFSLDDKIDVLRAQNTTLEEMAQRLFKEWFVDFNFPGIDGRPYKVGGGKMVESEYGETPEGWRTKSYTDLVNVLSGGTPKTDVPEYWNGQIPFFTPKDAKDTFYVDTTDKYITEAGLSACNSKLYPKDTVFITARGTVGKCALALRDMAMNQSCYALVGKDISNLFVFLLTKQLIDVIKKSASGAVFDAITVSTFNSLHVVLGDRQVTDCFEALIRPMFNKIANNTEEIFKLAELRDQLLPKLMSGELTMI